MKPITALALIDEKKKIIPEWIVSKKNRKGYILKKGEKFVEVRIEVVK